MISSAVKPRLSVPPLTMNIGLPGYCVVDFIFPLLSVIFEMYLFIHLYVKINEDNKNY